MKFVSSSETEAGSTATISEEPKSGRGMSTMPRVVQRKIQKIKPVVEYNEEGKPYGRAHNEMQSYIGVLARSRVPLVDKKWVQISKDIKEQIWEAVDMSFVVGKGGKTMVLSSAAKKWKDFKSTLTRFHILPFIKEQDRLRQPPETYKFIEKAQWDAFVASRLSEKFGAVHEEQSQRREKLEYNHRLSRKGYVGFKEDLKEIMPGVDIDRSTLWKKAREDKHGNIPDPKTAEKAKLIDDLQKQVSEGALSLSGTNDVLTMALGPEHPGRVRGVGAGVSPKQYFNLPRQQKVKFADQLKESVRLVLQEETRKMEARSREESLKMEARTKQLVEAEREYLLSQLSKFIPNFDPSVLNLNTMSQIQGQSPKNPMSDKASCSGALDVRALQFEEDTAKNGEKQEEMEVFGLERNTFVLHEDISQFANMEEIGATVVAVYMRCLFDHLKAANMVNMVGFIDPALVSADAGSLTERSRIVASRLQKTDGEQIFDPLPGKRVVDEDGKNILNSALKMYNSHIGRVGRKAPLWKTLTGTPKQPSSVECGYYVMRFMRDIILDPSLEFEKKFAKGNDEAPYPQAAIEEVRKEWAEFVCVHME
ncbi:hypothetical protein ACE6H2_026407 [Prunus campanulata]